MDTNVLRAISNIVNFGDYDLGGYATKYAIRINAVGERLEFYLNDAFADSFGIAGDKNKENYYFDQKVFSYLANQNNPPDIIINEGDAFEIKKIENPKNDIALNSSPPKDRLYRSDRFLTEKCRSIEGGKWESKDLFYVIGHVKNQKINYLFFIHGLCYAASPEVYDRIYKPLKKNISSSIKSVGLEDAETFELGRINRIDPLGITSLRVRGMWQIQNPLKLYNTIFNYNDSDPFTLFALMTKIKFESYPSENIDLLKRNSLVKISQVMIKDPNNLAERLETVAIQYKAKPFTGYIQ